VQKCCGERTIARAYAWREADGRERTYPNPAGHGALLIGPRHPFAPRAAEWRQTLGGFEIDLNCDGRLVDRGEAGNVLGGPLSALRHLTGLLGSDPVNPPLAAGEIVSTGTLTKAMPVAPGETWSAAPRGIGLDPVSIRLV